MTVRNAILKLKEVTRQLEAWIRKPKAKPVPARPKPVPKPKPAPTPRPASKQVTMYDTIDVSTVPPNPEAVAGYLEGNWPTYKPLVAKFPHAHHLSINVFPANDGECLDVENGDATPGQVPAWVRRQHARGIARPVIYASLSAMPKILALLSADHTARRQVRLWTAHYTYKAHLCTPACGFGFGTTADATQWTDKALNRNLDQSLCSSLFFPTGGH